MLLNNRLIHLSTFGPKLEWLKRDSGFDKIQSRDRFIRWLWETLPNYSPVENNYQAELMVSEDLEEETRLMDQDPMQAFLNVWLKKMVEDDNAIREKVALFWHHHIPSGPGHKTDHARLLLEIYREHGLGDLRTLLVGMAANPAMMYHLDGHHSHKNNPNENFPRELFEIFTLGEGYYSQSDVKESARAFTGRRFDHNHYPYSMFVDEMARDSGIKTILGESGDFRGEDVIDIILKQEQTARHITRSAIRFFCTDKPQDQMVEDCSIIYRNSGHNMKSLLTAIFSHPEFDNSAPKIKTPVELLIGFQRHTGLRTTGMKTNKIFLRYCGQVFFLPPSVAGWSGGEDWLKGGKILNRLFLTVNLLRISNRCFSRSSISYKLLSRIKYPELREFRYIADAKWNDSQFWVTINKSGFSASSWIIGKESALEDLELLLSAPDYQYM
jgi:uncharacterized protein (DUF1800 family)